MLPPGSATPSADLARRLRSLRVEEWTDIGVTQRDIATALGGLSIATISSWENGGRLPGREHLVGYARFFASRRSLQGGKARLLPDDELTPDERTRLAELEQELNGLRLAAVRVDGAPVASAGSAAGRFDAMSSGTFAFPDTQDVTIGCSALPEEHLRRIEDADESSPDYAESYGYADLDALIELHGHIRAASPRTQVNIRQAAEMTTDDLTSHLVLLGGIDLNPVTEEVMERLSLPIRQVSPDDRADGYFEVIGSAESTDSGEPRRYGPHVRKSGDRRQLEQDVALFLHGPNPFNKARRVTVCNAMFGRGTLGAVRALTDLRFRDRNELYLHTRFSQDDAFALLVKVPIVRGKTITPDWTGDEVRLYEWPER
jgi:transcriptional regulator with XRE-family HTH domain